MAEGRRGDRSQKPEDDSEEISQGTAPTPKKKKKHSKTSLAFFLLLLSLGAASGLHFSGIWDARPLMWSIIPQIPYIGESLSEFFHIPEQYTLTTSERRTYELEEWKKRLDERERDLNRRESAVEMASGDVGARSERLAKQEASRQTAEKNSDNAASDTEKKLMDQVVKTYQDMSSRNAAQIVEQVREPLAVELLQKLPPDARASIFGKMAPSKAARLTELMAGSD